MNGSVEICAGTQSGKAEKVKTDENLMLQAACHWGSCHPGGSCLARALAIKDYILDTQQVEAERVFLIKPDNTLAPEKVEGVAPGRVVLGLK